MLSPHITLAAQNQLIFFLGQAGELWLVQEDALESKSCGNVFWS